MTKKTSPAQLRAEAKYEAKPAIIQARDGRNKARAIMEKAGKVHKGDGKDVDHKNYNKQDEALSNLRVLSKHANRSRNRHGGKG